MTLSDIASGLSGGADGRVVIGVTAEPISIIAVARRVGAAWTNRAILSRAPVEFAVSAVHIAFIIFRIVLDGHGSYLSSSLGDNPLQSSDMFWEVILGVGSHKDFFWDTLSLPLP